VLAGGLRVLRRMEMSLRPRQPVHHVQNRSRLPWKPIALFATQVEEPTTAIRLFPLEKLRRASAALSVFRRIDADLA
jgi:hypothetical protein